MARKKPRSGGPGLYRFVPTDQEREQVKSLAGYGIPQEQIARILPRKISLTTLRRHFTEELLAGAALANAKVVQTLYQMAVGRPATYDQEGRQLTAEIEPVASCAIYWTKARMGWRDSVKIESEHTHKVDLSKLTEKQLDQLEAIHRALGTDGPVLDGAAVREETTRH